MIKCKVDKKYKLKIKLKKSHIYEIKQCNFQK